MPVRSIGIPVLDRGLAAIEIGGDVAHARQAAEHEVLGVALFEVEIAGHDHRLADRAERGRQLAELGDPVRPIAAGDVLVVAGVQMGVDEEQRHPRDREAKGHEALAAHVLALLHALGVPAQLEGLEDRVLDRESREHQQSPAPDPD